MKPPSYFVCRIIPSIVLMAFLLTSTVFGLGISEAQAAAVPTVLSYQGRLTDASGSLLGGSGTNYYFKFSLWTNSTIGSGTKLWPTSAPSSFATQVKQGVFNVNIGDTTNGYPDALDYNFANVSNIYLQVEVSSDNVSFETLSPRQLVTSSAFSQVSGSVSGVNASTFGTTSQINNSVVSVVSTTSNSVGLTVRGANSQSANIFAVQDSAGSGLLSVSASGGLQVGALANCNTIDTDASGNFICGTDEGGVGSAWATTSNEYWLTTQTTSGLSEGSNLYFTNSRADARAVAILAATTTLNNLTTLRGLTDLITTNATTTTFTLGSDYVTDLTGSNLSIVNGALTALGDGTWATTSANFWESTQSRWSTSSDSLAFDERLAGTTTLPNLAILRGLTDLIATRATTTNATSTNLAVTTLAVGTDIISDITGTGLSVMNGALTVTVTDTAFSTTSADYWDSLISRWATTSDSYAFDTRLAATTTLNNITTLGSLSLPITQTTGTLSVSRGGTGQTSFGQGWLASDGTTITSSTSPTVAYITATSTTATSTFPILSANTLLISSLLNCDTLDTDASGRIVCGADAGAGGGLTSLNGLINSTQSFATTSDTNIGLSIVSSGSTHTFSPTWTGTLSVARGGTGLGSFTNNQILIGNALGGISQVSTSSLGLLTTNVAEGTNLYFTNDRFDTRLAATTTLNNITTLRGLTDLITTNATTTTFALGADYITDITGSNLSIVNGALTATLDGAFSTTSADFWETTQSRWSTSSDSLAFDERLAATTTLNNLTTLGSLSLPLTQTTGTLSVARGGTGQTSFGQGWLSSDGTTITSSTSPTVAYITATSTTATSTLPYVSSRLIYSNRLDLFGNTGTDETVINISGDDDYARSISFSESAIEDGYLRFDHDTNNFSLTNKTAGELALGTNNLTRLLITSTGNVGIGTTSPYAKLSVVGQTVAEYFTATSTTATSTFPLLAASGFRVSSLTSCDTIDTDLNGFLICGTDEGGAGGTWATTSSDYWVTTKNALPTLNVLSGLAWIGSTTGTTTFLGATIFDGNVGIGTTNPTEQLEVANTIKIGNELNISAVGSAGDAGVYFNDDQNTGLFSPAADMFAITTAGTERMRIDADGGVGIGSTTPFAMLSVSTASTSSSVPAFVIGSSTKTDLLVNGVNGNISMGTTTTARGKLHIENFINQPSLIIDGALGGSDMVRLYRSVENGGTGNYGLALKVQLSNPSLLFRSGTSASIEGTSVNGFTHISSTNSFLMSTTSSASGLFSGFEPMYMTNSNSNIGFAGTTTPWGSVSINGVYQESGEPTFVIGSSTKTDFIVQQSGFVGIGTTSPMTTLSASSTTVTPAAVIDQRGSGAILALQKSGVDKFVVANNGGLTISASTNDLVKSTTGGTRSSDFSVSGSTLFNVTSSNDILELDEGTIPAGGQGTLTSTSSTTPSAIGAGGHVILREDGMYVVIHGGASTAVSLWNGTSSAMTALGITLNANAGAGSISVRRNDGRYLVIHGGGVNTTSVIDPYGRTPTVAGPTTGGSCTTGTNAFQRADGKYVLMCGGTNTTSVYDPVAGTFATGPVSTLANYGAGAHAIQRENGTFLVFVGGNTTSHYTYNPNTSAVGTFTDSNPITSNAPTITTGSFSIRRQDGKFFVMGGAINTSSIYDPTETATTTNMGAGTMTAQSGAGLGPTAALADGAQAVWRQDGKYLLIIGSGSTVTNIIDPSQSDSTQFTSGPSLATTPGAGLTAFMNPVGHYSILSGGGSSIDDYDMGYIIGGKYSNELSAYYETECMSAPGLNPQSTIGWHTSNEGRFSVQVKTGTGSCSGSYKDIQKSGDLILEDAATDDRVQVKVFFQRALPRFYDQEWNIRRTGLVRYRRNQMDPSLYDIYIDNGALYKRNIFDFANNSSTASSTIPTTVNLVVKTDGVGLGYTNISNPEYNNSVNTTNSAFFNGSYATGTPLIYGVASSSLVMKRPDGKFVIITGATSTPNSQLYNPDDETIVAQTNIPTTNVGLGTLAVKRPDGKFLIVMGNAGTATTTTNIYDPVSNTYVYGPALMGPAGRGALVIPLPTGKFLIVHGNFTTRTSVYDPYQNTMSVGPVTQNVAGAGSMALPRPDGTYLFIPGTTNETCTLSTATNIFDPSQMTFRTNPNQTLTTGVGAGAFAFQRTDGLYVIVHGGGTAGGCAATNRTAIYNPFNNQIIVGPTLTAIPSVATQRWEGNHAFQAADGSWVMMVAGATSSVRTLIYQEKTGAYTANMPAGTAIGAWISGSTQGPWTGGSGRTGALGNYNSIGPGAISFQLPGGEYMLVGGAASSSATSTATFKMDMGWVSQGMYRTEQISVPDLDSNSVLNWKVSPSHLGVSAEVRTAATQAGLQTAIARPISRSGDKINPNTGDVWLQVTFNFKRDFPSYKGVYTDVWYNGSTPVHTTRDIQSPTLSEISVTKDIDALNLNADGLSVFRVTSSGSVYTADGATINTSGADLAERYTSQVPLENGEVVAIDPQNNHGIRKTVYQYQPDVIGVVSTAPGFVAGAYTKDSYPVALVGRVPVKVTTENGMIYSGDRLAPSSVPGYAMKATLAGRVIGKALENLDETKLTDCPIGTANVPGRKCGTVMMFVNLIDYSGNSVESSMAEWNRIKSLATTPRVTVEGPLLDISTSTAPVSSTEDNILAYLNEVKIERENGLAPKSEIFSDKVTAITSIIAPQLYADAIKTKTIMGGALIIDTIGSTSTLVSMISDTTFFGRTYFTKDTGGTAIIKKGATQVDVTFEKEYIETPIVNATMSFGSDLSDDDAQKILDSGVSYIVTKKSVNGFTIRTKKAIEQDIVFNWTALAIKNGGVFTSREVIALPVANTTATSTATSTASTTPVVETVKEVQIIKNDQPANIIEALLPQASTTETTASSTPAVSTTTIQRVEDAQASSTPSATTTENTSDSAPAATTTPTTATPPTQPEPEENQPEEPQTETEPEQEPKPEEVTESEPAPTTNETTAAPTETAPAPTPAAAPEEAPEEAVTEPSESAPVEQTQ